MTNKREKDARMISVAFLIFSIVLFIYSAITSVNPDSDAFWLIETGRYISKNGIPKTNPWTYTENLGVIIQQPLCALFNYWWWTNAGLSGMWQLASIENMVLIIVMIVYVRLFNKDKTHIFSTVALMEVVIALSGIGSTRPYQLTMTNMFLLLGALEKARQKDSMKLVYIATFLTTLFQANYQMASVWIIPCFISVYVFGTGFNRLKNKERIREGRFVQWIAVYVLWFLVSLLNPYKLKGMKYLLLSRQSLSLVGNKIVELNKPQIISATGVMIFAVICSLVYKYKKQQELDWCEIFLLFGASFASSLATRNMWMLIIAFCMIYGKINFDRSSNENNQSPFLKKIKYIFLRLNNEVWPFTILNRKPSIDKSKEDSVSANIFSKGFVCASVLAFAFVIISSSSLGVDHIESYNKLIALVDSVPQDSKLYTCFNTGSYAEYLGRKIYVDARPELYSSKITGSNDIISEWYNLEWVDMNFEEYVKNNDWEYYLVTKNTPISFYLSYSGSATLLGEECNQELYKINN